MLRENIDVRKLGVVLRAGLRNGKRNFGLRSQQGSTMPALDHGRVVNDSFHPPISITCARPAPSSCRHHASDCHSWPAAWPAAALAGQVRQLAHAAPSQQQEVQRVVKAARPPSPAQEARGQHPEGQRAQRLHPAQRP